MTEPHSNKDSVARLDGVLYACSAFSGALREFEGRAYLLPSTRNAESIDEEINQYFEGQFVFEFAERAKLGSNGYSGLGDLEQGIQPFLLRDESRIKAEHLSELRHYLSFRILDLIEDIFGIGHQLNLEYHQLAAGGGTAKTESVFFCVRSETEILVLQFNDYRADKR